MKKRMKKRLFDIIFMAFYFIPFKIQLRKAGVKKSAVFYGKAPLNGCAYFTGEIEQKSVFIKFDTKYHLLNNDIVSYKHCKSKLDKYLVKIVGSKVTGKIQYIIYEFFDGATLKHDDILQNPQLILDIYKIISSIKDVGLIHRDIKPDNFLLKNNKIKIIDLTLMASLDNKIKFKSFCKGDKAENKILHFLNLNYSPPGLVWNDFYSLQTILKEILGNKNVEEATKSILEEWIVKIEKDVKGSSYQLQADSNE